MNKYWRMCQHWSMLDSNKRNMRSICETYFNAYNDQNLFYKTLKWIRETSTLSSSKAFLFFQSFPGNEHKYWEVEFLLGFPYIDPYYRSASFHHINPYNLIYIFSHLSVCPILSPALIALWFIWRGISSVEKLIKYEIKTKSFMRIWCQDRSDLPEVSWWRLNQLSTPITCLLRCVFNWQAKDILYESKLQSFMPDQCLMPWDVSKQPEAQSTPALAKFLYLTNEIFSINHHSNH